MHASSYGREARHFAGLDEGVERGELLLIHGPRLVLVRDDEDLVEVRLGRHRLRRGPTLGEQLADKRLERGGVELGLPAGVPAGGRAGRVRCID